MIPAGTGRDTALAAAAAATAPKKPTRVVSIVIPARFCTSLPPSEHTLEPGASRILALSCGINRARTWPQIFSAARNGRMGGPFGSEHLDFKSFPRLGCGSIGCTYRRRSDDAASPSRGIQTVDSTPGGQHLAGLIRRWQNASGRRAAVPHLSRRCHGSGANVSAQSVRLRKGLTLTQRWRLGWPGVQRGDRGR